MKHFWMFLPALFATTLLFAQPPEDGRLFSSGFHQSSIQQDFAANPKTSNLEIHDRPLPSAEIRNAAVLPPRPALNKNAYKGMIWCHANPWFPPNGSPNDPHSLGSPEIAWIQYPSDPVMMWKQAAEVCAPYGLNGLSLEIIPRENGKAGYIEVFKSMLEGFRLAGNNFKGMVFLTPKKYKGDMPNIMAQAFRELLPLIKEHPNAYRLNGSPVVSVYIPYVFTPREWYAIISEVEKVCGRIVWLADIRNTYVRQDAPQGFSQWLRDYLQVFDGITLYANWSAERQADFLKEVVPVMHREFPDKIFETGPHNTFTPHTRYEGMRPRLTEKFIKSWELTLKSNPDSITITNFFDIEEYSRVLPSYEMDDILLNISEYYIRNWKKLPPAESVEPTLYVVNYTNVVLGADALFEVIGFPFKGTDKKAVVQLELCDEKGAVLHAFPKKELLLDSLRVIQYTLPTLPYAKDRALFPRLRYSIAGKEMTAEAFPPTMLAANLLPHLLTWSRSTAHMIPLDSASRNWSLNGARPGQTLAYPTDGIAEITWRFSGKAPSLSDLDAGRIRLLRNGREIKAFKRKELQDVKNVKLPDPGDSIDQYALELEDGKGGRYLASSIWVSKNTRSYQCVLPVVLSDRSIANVQIEGGRVPFFYYPCDQSSMFLPDCSGYDHRGMLSAIRASWSKYRMRGYRHEYCDGIPPSVQPDAPEFRKEKEGSGFLHFDADRKTCVFIDGGTAFPCSFTCELSVRPDKSDRLQGLLSTANGQYNLALTPDGKVRAWRVIRKKERNDVSAELFSKAPLKSGQWSRIALVYDLRELSLYVNGEAQGKASSPPDPRHQWMNFVIIGALCISPWNPVEFFSGDIRQIRLYGRNLAPSEFLGAIHDRK